jgi:hypothetical protein
MTNLWLDQAVKSAVIPDAATFAVPADAESNGTVFIVPNLTANIVITLPRVKANRKFEFIYGGAAADAQNWSIATSGGDLFKGALLAVTPTGPVAAAAFANGTSHVAITVATPSGGSRISLVSDGLAWYVDGVVVSATPVVFA